MIPRLADLAPAGLVNRFLVIGMAGSLALSTWFAGRAEAFIFTYSKPGVTLGGTNSSGQADPRSEFIVTMKYDDGSPVSGVYIFIVFAFQGQTFCSDVRMCHSPGVPMSPGQTCGSGHSMLGTYTDPQGRAVFRIVGQAVNSGASPGETGPCAQIMWYAGNYQSAGTVKVAAFDHDGGGLSPTDLSLFNADRFSGQYFARSDYNFDNLLNVADFSVFLNAYYGGGSTHGCTSYVCVP